MPRKVDNNILKHASVINGSQKWKRYECRYCKVTTTFDKGRIVVHLNSCEEFKQKASARVLEEFKLTQNLLESTHVENMNNAEKEIDQVSSKRDAESIQSSQSEDNQDESLSRKSEESDNDSVKIIDRPKSKSESSTGTKSEPISGGSIEITRPDGIKKYSHVAITKPMREAIDYAIATWIHLTGTSFSITQQKTFQDMLLALCPSYINCGVVVSSESVSGRLLAKHANSRLLDVHKILLECSALTLTTDGWTDVNGRSLHNVMVCTPMPFLLGDYRLCNDAGGETKVELFNMVKTFLIDIKKIYTDNRKEPPSVIGLCTDSPNSNKGMRDLVTKSSDPEFKDTFVVVYGCACHALNNHGKDVSNLPKIKEILEKVKIVIKVCRNVKSVRQLLHKCQKQVPPHKVLQMFLPVETRWSYNILMLESLISSQKAIMEMCNICHYSKEGSPNLGTMYSGEKNDKKYGSVETILRAKNFWNEVEAVLWILRPIAFCVHVLESDMMPISTVPTAFLYLHRLYRKNMSSSDKVERGYCKVLELDIRYFQRTSENNANASVPTTLKAGSSLPDLLERRWNEITANAVNPTQPGIASSLFQLALMLDDASRQFGLECNEMHPQMQLDPNRDLIDAVEDAIKTLCDRIPILKGKDEEVHTQIVRKIMRPSLFNKQKLTKKNLMHPIDHYVFKSMESKVIANCIFSLVPSSAAGERSFKVLGGVLTKTRNRMSDNKLLQMAMLRYNTKQLEREYYMRDFQRSEKLMNIFFEVENPKAFNLISGRPLGKYIDEKLFEDADASAEELNDDEVSADIEILEDYVFVEEKKKFREVQEEELSESSFLSTDAGSSPSHNDIIQTQTIRVSPERYSDESSSSESDMENVACESDMENEQAIRMEHMRTAETQVESVNSQGEPVCSWCNFHVKGEGECHKCSCGELVHDVCCQENIGKKEVFICKYHFRVEREIELLKKKKKRKTR